MENKCAAIQMSDQMVCNQCQLSWDMNDIDVPVCQAKEEDGNMVRDMTLRDHFATASLSGLEADHTINMSFEQKAEYCYKMADAMMKQRLK